jgi:carbamoyl-phosphate synthase large subunit
MAAAKASAEGIKAIKENRHFGVMSLQKHHDEIE